MTVICRCVKRTTLTIHELRTRVPCRISPIISQILRSSCCSQRHRGKEAELRTAQNAATGLKNQLDWLALHSHTLSQAQLQAAAAGAVRIQVQCAQQAQATAMLEVDILKSKDEMNKCGKKNVRPTRVLLGEHSSTAPHLPTALSQSSLHRQPWASCPPASCATRSNIGTFLSHR